MLNQYTCTTATTAESYNGYFTQTLSVMRARDSPRRASMILPTFFLSRAGFQKRRRKKQYLNARGRLAGRGIQSTLADDQLRFWFHKRYISNAHRPHGIPNFQSPATRSFSRTVWCYGGFFEHVSQIRFAAYHQQLFSFHLRGIMWNSISDTHSYCRSIEIVKPSLCVA